VLLSFFSTIGGFASLLLLVVPVGRFSMPYPTRVALGLGCGELNLSSISPLQVTLLHEPPCTLRENLSSSIRLSVESCGLVCQAPSALDLEQVTSVPVYRVDVSFEGQNDDYWFAPSVVLDKVNVVPEDVDPRSVKVNFCVFYLLP
jgi:hypothetical protein